VPSLIVALRPCSCRRRSRGILSAWLRLQSIAKGVVCGGRVVVVRLECAQLGNEGRQRLDVQSRRSRRTARPHVSFRTLEVAVMRWLREHCPRWWKRTTAAIRRRLWAFGGRLGLGAAISAGTRRACDLCRVHWRLHVRRVYGKRVSRSRDGARRGYMRCGSEDAPLRCCGEGRWLHSWEVGQPETPKRAGVDSR
jgi:hypothetical protein